MAKTERGGMTAGNDFKYFQREVKKDINTGGTSRFNPAMQTVSGITRSGVTSMQQSPTAKAPITKNF